MSERRQKNQLELALAAESRGEAPRGADRGTESLAGTPPRATAGVVDIDLERFFDRVNHDKLMGSLSFLRAVENLLFT